MPDLKKSNFNGLPLDVFNVLPEEIKNNLTDIKYTPEIIWQIVFDYFEGELIELYAKSIAKHWQIDFEERINKSYDKESFIKQEIKQYSYDELYKNISEVDPAVSIERYGYDMAINGEDYSISYLLKNNPAKAYYDIPQDTHSYDSLKRAIEKIELMISGFAKAIFFNKIKADSSTEYIGGVVQKNNDDEREQKLLWLGKPAHLALIIDLLIEKGYLKGTPYGERTAEILLTFFEFEDHKPTIESLGKLLHKDKYPIKDKTVVDKFYKIPNRTELK